MEWFWPNLSEKELLYRKYTYGVNQMKSLPVQMFSAHLKFSLIHLKQCLIRLNNGLLLRERTSKYKYSVTVHVDPTYIMNIHKNRTEYVSTFLKVIFNYCIWSIGSH